MSDKQIDISVLIPIYGVEKFIERSLRSIFSQSKTSGVEFILVNDCTKDNSMEIARALIAEFTTLDVKIIEHKENGGIAAARQTLLDNACGKYTIYIDSDDWCEPNMLEDMYNCALENNADIVSTDYYISKTQGEFYDTLPTPDNGKDALKGVLYGNVYWVLWNKLVRRSLYLDNERYFFPGFNFGEDMLVCAKLFAEAKKVTYLPKAYLHYVQNSSAVTNNLTKAKLDNLVFLMQEIDSLLSKYGYQEEMKEGFVVRKIATKQFIVYHSSGKLQREYAALYHEDTGSIKKLLNAPKYITYSLWLASKGFLFPFRLIRFLRNIKDSRKSSTKF